MIVPLVGNTDGEVWYGPLYWAHHKPIHRTMVQSFVGHWGNWEHKKEGWHEDMTNLPKESVSKSESGGYVSIYQAIWVLGDHS